MDLIGIARQVKGKQETKDGHGVKFVNFVGCHLGLQSLCSLRDVLCDVTAVLGCLIHHMVGVMAERLLVTVFDESDYFRRRISDLGVSVTRKALW